MPIDYSKWDNLEVSDSDDEEAEDGDPSPFRPARVTRLEAPSSVTFGGPGGTISATPDVPTEAATSATTPKPAPPAAEGLASSSSSISAKRETAVVPVRSPGPPPSWTERGGFLDELPATASDHGDTKRSLCWSQDRYSVTLRLELAEKEKVASVSVGGILPYRDRNAATATVLKPKLVVVVAAATTTTTTGRVVLRSDLPHPVHRTEEDDEAAGDDEGLLDDWTVDDSAAPKRFLVVVLYKAVPMEGLALWWRRPLADVPEADLSTIRGSGKGEIDAAASSKAEEFRKTWEEAHEQFRANQKIRKPTILS